jgi:hypothetical protein
LREARETLFYFFFPFPPFQANFSRPISPAGLFVRASRADDPTSRARDLTELSRARTLMNIPRIIIARNSLCTERPATDPRDPHDPHGDVLTFLRSPDGDFPSKCHKVLLLNAGTINHCPSPWRLSPESQFHLIGDKAFSRQSNYEKGKEKEEKKRKREHYLACRNKMVGKFRLYQIFLYFVRGINDWRKYIRVPALRSLKPETVKYFAS